MPIPSFNASSVLPPFTGVWPQNPSGFSPYSSNIAEVSTRFGTSAERRAILVGFIDLRTKIRSLGCGIEYQWIDGSFAEDIEVSEGRPPGDIDVLTFLTRPAAASSPAAFSALINANLDVFLADQAKAAFKCDHYPLDLNANPTVQMICYWHSLFSHRRNGLWKGYVHLADEGDAADQAVRDALMLQGIA